MKCYVIEGKQFDRLKQLRKRMGFSSFSRMVDWILDYMELGE